MRTFEQTHPWLKFSVDLRQAPFNLWIMLGECQSKCEHISWAPLLPEVQKRVHELYLVKGSLATTAIEGNTLSEKEVMLRLEQKLQLPPSKEYLGIEVDNIIEACNGIVQEVMQDKAPVLSLDRIRQFNEKVLSKLDLDEEIDPGQIRKHAVGVARYKAPLPEDCGYLVNRLCEWLNGPDFDFPKGMAMVSAIVKAILAHLYLAWIHPFGDGNGRAARLVEFQILISSGVPAPAAHLLSNHYNQTRTEYYRQLDRASKSGGDVVAFLRYAVQGFLDGLRDQLKEIRDQQWEVVWRDHIWQHFRDRHTLTDQRRRKLVFALSKEPGLVPISRLSRLHPDLAVAYADKTNKAVLRDINALAKLGLVTKERSAVRARKEAILGFLPAGTAWSETAIQIILPGS